METAATIVNLAMIYLSTGGVVALFFLIFGIDRIDPAARGSYAFRPLIAPGIALLWPLVLWRWRALERSRP